MNIKPEISGYSSFLTGRTLVYFWIAVQALLIYQFGIVTKLEAATYIDVAKTSIATGHYPSGNFLFYSVQIWLDKFCILSGIGFWPIVLLQILLNGLSTILLYRLLLKFSGRNMAAFALTAAFIGMYYYQLYNVHLYTESIYFSLGIIFTYHLFSLRKLSVTTLASVILFILLLCLTRPTGIFFFPAAGLYVIFRFYRKKALLFITISIAAGLFLFYFIVNFAIGSGGALDFLVPYVTEQVICGIPSVTARHDIIVRADQNSIQGLWYIITHYPKLFFSLGAKRLIAFWGMYRDHYSVFHNIFICSYFFSIYLLIVLSVKKILDRFAEAAYMFTLVILLALTVVLSCDEWHNRFILGILPFLLLMASMFFKKTHSHQS